MLQAAAFLLLALQPPAASAEPKDDLSRIAREWGRCIGGHAIAAMAENRTQPVDPVIDAAFQRCRPEQERVRAEWVRVAGEEAVEAQFPTLMSMARARAATTVREWRATLSQ